jgi:mannitol/fructose-specific phosphotransferase system IIA component (Ntr-type)
MIVAFGMNSRGAMEIILGVLGLQFGLINQELFVAIVIMALVTSISSGPLMNFFMRRSSTFTRPSLLLSSGQTIFLKSKDRSGAIHELSALAARRCKLSKPEIAESVLQREKEFATGLARGLAIPHARLPIPHPILCAGITKEGVSFDAADGLPARLVFLLLTPLEEHEKQLELLAGLAKLAEHENIVDDIASRSSSFAAYQRVIFYLSRSSS